MISSAQHNDCLGLVDAVIDAAGDEERSTLDTEKLVRRAGARAHIERCWGSTEELAAAAYCHAARMLFETMAAALAAPGPWLDRWEAGVRDVVELVRRRPGLARLALVETEGGLDVIRERRMLYRRQFIDLLRTEYVRGRETRELPELHLELLAGAVYRAFHREAVAGRLTREDVDVVPRLVDVMAILEPVAA